MELNCIENKKVAIVHYWLDSYRGGEKVVEALCEMFPQADIFTHTYNSAKLPDSITSHNIYTTFIAKLPFAGKYYRHYLPLMPLATYFLNLKKYDLIISSESGPAKYIRKKSNALHICYCHSPMRYIWDMQKEYIDSIKFKNNSEKLEVSECFGSWKDFLIVIKRQILNIGRSIFNFIFSIFWKITACYMRYWDRLSAKKVDFFIANSNFIAMRIRKFYKRKSTVIHPPVNINKFNHDCIRENYYLCVSELVAYKKVDLVVRAFNKLKLPLIVVGGGSEFDYINSFANGNIQMLGNVTDEVLAEKFEKCRAFVYAGKEDFGIIFPEALSAGAPVIAFNKGGVRDVIQDKKHGVLFNEQSVDSIIKAVKMFDGNDIKINSSLCREKASFFSDDLFKSKIFSFIVDKMVNYR